MTEAFWGLIFPDELRKVVPRRRALRLNALWSRQLQIPVGRMENTWWAQEQQRRAEWISLTDLKVASSYSKQRGDAAGRVGRSPPTDTPLPARAPPTPGSPQVPKVPKAVAKRRSNCSFHGCNGSPLSSKQEGIAIKYAEVYVNFTLKFQQNFAFGLQLC